MAIVTLPYVKPSSMLRPLSVADLVDEIFRLYRGHLGLFFGISALVWLPASIFFVLGRSLIGDFTQRGFTGDAGLGFSMFGVGGLIALVTFPLLVGAITEAVSQTYLGRTTTIGASFARGRDSFWRITIGYVAVFVILGLGVFLVTVVGAGVAFALGGPAGILLGVVAIVAGIALAVWIAVTWSLLAQAIIVEGVGIGGGLRRSAQLVHRARWRVIGINVLLALIGAVLFTIPSAFIALALAPLPLPGTISNAFTQLVGAFAQAAYYPIQLGTMTLLYFDLRVRKEGFDLTLAAERLRGS